MNFPGSVVFLLYILSVRAMPAVDTGSVSRIDKFGPMNQPFIADPDPAPNSDQNGPSRIGVHTYSEVQNEQVKRVDSALEWFVMRLNGYVNDTMFDSEAFSTAITDLRNQLSNVDFVIETRLSLEHRTEKHASVVRTVFQRMVDATDKLKRYRGSKANGRDQICKMLELEVLAYIHSLKGFTNRQIGGYMLQKTRLYCRIEELKQEIWRQSSVPVGVLSLFETIAGRTRKMLEASMKLAGINTSVDHICPVLSIVV